MIQRLIDRAFDFLVDELPVWLCVLAIVSFEVSMLYLLAEILTSVRTGWIGALALSGTLVAMVSGPGLIITLMYGRR